MGPEPRVLIIETAGSGLEPLARGLDALGWRTLTTRSGPAGVAAVADLSLEAVVVDAGHADYPSMLASLRAAAADRRLAIVAIGSPADAADVDLAMSAPPHPAQAALRLEQLVRASVAEEEFQLRRATFASRGEPMTTGAAPIGPLRVLVAGGVDPRFLALSNTLTREGVDVVAAPTPYTAFDYLHESSFDAAVLWGGPDHAPALSIASGMKRNTRLYHIPLVLYLRHQAEIDLDELYGRGFADVATADTPEGETAARVLSLARMHRRHLSIRKGLEGARSSALMDAPTGLFTRELFAVHVSRLAEAARVRRRPLSIAVLRIANNDVLTHARMGGWLDRALPQIGAMVGRLVRVEDTAGRLASEVFALALPATPGPAARLAAERIAAVIACTAFDAGPERAPFVVEFDLGVAEVSPGESPASVLERASADLSRRRARTEPA